MAHSLRTTSAGFEKYLAQVEDDVTLRKTVGLIAPADDLLAELYHPELKEKLDGAREQKPVHAYCLVKYARVGRVLE